MDPVKAVQMVIEVVITHVSKSCGKSKFIQGRKRPLDTPKRMIENERERKKGRR